VTGINGIGEERTGRGGRCVRFSLIVAFHVAVIAIVLEWTVPPAFEGDSRPFYARLLENPPPTTVERPLPSPPRAAPPPRAPAPPVLAAADAPGAATFAVPPQPPQPIAPPPPPTVAGPPPALVQAHVDADYLDNPKPVYPSFSRRAGEEGTVSLRVRVGVEGRALAVEVARSSGFPRLDEAARDAVSRWRFVPARRGDNAVDSWVLVPVSFQLRG